MSNLALKEFTVSASTTYWGNSFHVLRSSFSVPMLRHTMTYTPCAGHHLLEKRDGLLSESISVITNSFLSDLQWLQNSLPILRVVWGSDVHRRWHFLPFWPPPRAHLISSSSFSWLARPWLKMRFAQHTAASMLPVNTQTPTRITNIGRCAW